MYVENHGLLVKIIIELKVMSREAMRRIVQVFEGLDKGNSTREVGADDAILGK